MAHWPVPFPWRHSRLPLWAPRVPSFPGQADPSPPGQALPSAPAEREKLRRAESTDPHTESRPGKNINNGGKALFRRCTYLAPRSLGRPWSHRPSLTCREIHLPDCPLPPTGAGGTWNSQAGSEASQQINLGQSECGVLLRLKVAPAKKNTFERLFQNTCPQSKNIQNNLACLGWVVLLWVSLQPYRGVGSEDSSIYGALPGVGGFSRDGTALAPARCQGEARTPLMARCLADP